MTIADQQQWHEGKIPILREITAQAETARAAAAARRWVFPPGPLQTALTSIEMEGKWKLQELNAVIVREAVERELKEQAHGYDQAYLDAQVAWELEKAQLLTDIQKEFADIKRSEGLAWEEVELLFIELAVRKAALIALKAAIEEDMEEVRQDMAEEETKVLPYESSLALQKKTTAQKRLALIPILGQLIAKEQEVLAAERNMIGPKEQLVAARENLLSRESSLVPLYDMKAARLGDLVAAVRRALTYECNIMDIAVTRAGYELRAVANEADILARETQLQDKQNDADALRTDMRIHSALNEGVLLSDRGAYHIARAGIVAAGETVLGNLRNEIDDARREIHKTETEGSLNRHGKEARDQADSDRTRIQSVASNQSYRERSVAEANASAVVTSHLIHLLEV